MDDIDKREAALLARLEAEREQRLVEKFAAGEVVSIPLFIVAGSEPAARAQVEQVKADKLAELRAAGETREVKFDVTFVVTGVRQHGEEPAGEPWKPVSPPFLPRSSSVGTTRPPDEVSDAEEVVPKEPQPPIIETYIAVQTRRCHDDDDVGEVAEGYFSVDDNRRVTVTNKSGGYVGSRTMIAGEDARVVAKQLLREKSPEAENFNRRLSYPNAGFA
jgi:hypothetical protein